MTNYDVAQICRLLQREDDDILSRLQICENTYQIFKRYDQFDFLELLTLRIRADELRDFEQKLLKLMYYLVDQGGE